MRLTPNQFAKQLPKWYYIWREHNAPYFPVEKQLTQKAHLVGYFEMGDLIAVTEVLGNPYNIRGKIQRANTNDEVKEKTKEAIKHLMIPQELLRA